MPNTLSKTVETVRVAWLRIASPRRRALHNIPPGLYDYWARTAHIEFKGIPRDAFFYVRAADALLTFFECVRRSSRPCALPSKAADSVWHAWLRYSPASLDAFCERHFGRRIAHVEAAGMAGGMALPMAATLVAARALDGLGQFGCGVPRLFATDRALRMPRGFAWRGVGIGLACSRMDRHGQPVGAGQVHPATMPDFLFGAGLVAQGDYDEWLRECRKHDRDRAIADAAGSNADAACDIATGGGDSSDGGSSCGSSCGGGCGGGGCGS